MGIFDSLLDIASSIVSESSDSRRSGVIETGRQKNTGGHDHRSNTGDNRTPAQKKGDIKRKKDD